MPDRNFRDVVAEDVVALGCRGDEPSAQRTGRARSDLQGVRLSLSPESKPIHIETWWPVPASGQVGANRRQKHSNS